MKGVFENKTSRPIRLMVEPNGATLIKPGGVVVGPINLLKHMPSLEFIGYPMKESIEGVPDDVIQLYNSVENIPMDDLPDIDDTIELKKAKTTSTGMTILREELVTSPRRLVEWGVFDPLERTINTKKLKLRKVTVNELRFLLDILDIDYSDDENKWDLKKKLFAATT